MKGLVLILLLLSPGCAAVLDLAHGPRYTRTVEDRSPTGETVQWVEYRSDPKAGTLECIDTRRAIERRRKTEQTFRRRNGLGKETYTGAVLGDLLLGGLVAAVAGGFCLNADDPRPCWGLLWAAPFALDLPYALVRRQTTLPAVLVSKTTISDGVALGELPLEARPTGCESVDSVKLGFARGPDPEARLQRGGAEGQVLVAGALPVAFTPDRGLDLSAEVLAGWLKSPGAKLWVVEAGGEARELRGPVRCQVLRAQAARVPEDLRSALAQACSTPTDSP